MSQQTPPPPMPSMVALEPSRNSTQAPLLTKRTAPHLVEMISDAFGQKARRSVFDSFGSGLLVASDDAVPQLHAPDVIVSIPISDSLWLAPSPTSYGAPPGSEQGPTSLDADLLTQQLEQDIAQIFYSELARWRDDTLMTSNQTAILMHKSHYKIIGLGTPALPYIFRDLANGGGNWFVALESITRKNAVRMGHEMNAKLMRGDWLDWGREHGYLRA